MEDKILKEIYGLVKGDASPVHLPVSPEVVSQTAGIPLEDVMACCRILENHGYLTSGRGVHGAVYYYITKMGIAEIFKPSLSLYLYTLASGNRKRA
ncbi:hypothetical protein [Rufibacter sp. LB8]|uniref:hypothetical protein n=1 Tax=Rufibacter sp. LB8 TaxID=2777781 RepID=UPI001CEF5D97|nr:hypothetical protein [Rufibacter sp. LB8]